MIKWNHHLSWIFCLILLLFTPVMAMTQMLTSPFDTFDHQVHNNRFAQYSVGCDQCHKTPNSYKRTTVEKGGCHFCHNSPASPSRLAQNAKCMLCHIDRKSVRPKDHEDTSKWTSLHQDQARKQKDACLKCHKVYDCKECHDQVHNTKKRTHSLLYEYYHAIDAKTQPDSCKQCHEVTFCQRCHALK